MARSKKTSSLGGESTFFKSAYFLPVLIIVIVFVLGFITVPKFFVISYQNGQVIVEKSVEDDSVKNEELKPKTLHLPTPKPLRGIYMTSCVAGTPSIRDGLVKLIEETEINAVVIDVKDYSGTISFKPANPELIHLWANARCGALDMKEFLEDLGEKG